MKLISILLFLTLGACAHKPVPHTYLKYSGYIDGCAAGVKNIVMTLNSEVTEENINNVWLDAICMELYLIKLETESIKPSMKRFDRNEMI